MDETKPSLDRAMSEISEIRGLHLNAGAPRGCGATGTLPGAERRRAARYHVRHRRHGAPCAPCRRA